MNKIVIAVGPVLFALLVFYLVDFYFMYNKGFIDDVCKLYKQGEVTGSLCQDICETKTIIPTECKSSAPDKFVYLANWHNNEIILKKVHARLNEPLIENSKHEDNYKHLIKDKVHALFGECENCSSLVDKLINIADTNNDRQLSIIETKTMLKLLSTSEPAMLLILNGSDVSLSFYGYCGSLYAVEKLHVLADVIYGFEWNLIDITVLPDILEPLEQKIKHFSTMVSKLLSTFTIISDYVEPALFDFKSNLVNYFVRVRVPSIKERFSFIKSHLDGIYSLSKDGYGLVQSCDIHLGNFGLTKQNKFKVLDYDLILPQFQIQNILGSKPCVQDDDCSVGDFQECTSKCNKSTGFCSKTLNTQMIHNVCFSSFPLMFRNLHNDFKYKNEALLKCLENEIQDTGLYCLKLPLANNTQQLHSQIEHVKERFVNISQGKFSC